NGLSTSLSSRPSPSATLNQRIPGRLSCLESRRRCPAPASAIAKAAPDVHRGLRRRGALRCPLPDPRLLQRFLPPLLRRDLPGRAHGASLVSRCNRGSDQPPAPLRDDGRSLVDRVLGERSAPARRLPLRRGSVLRLSRRAGSLGRA